MIVSLNQRMFLSNSPVLKKDPSNFLFTSQGSRFADPSLWRTSTKLTKAYNFTIIISVVSLAEFTSRLQWQKQTSQSCIRRCSGDTWRAVPHYPHPLCCFKPPLTLGPAFKLQANQTYIFISSFTFSLIRRVVR